jgi:hypothetical protein
LAAVRMVSSPEYTSEVLSRRSEKLATESLSGSPALVVGLLNLQNASGPT